MNAALLRLHCALWRDSDFCDEQEFFQLEILFYTLLQVLTTSLVGNTLVLWTVLAHRRQLLNLIVSHSSQA